MNFLKSKFVAIAIIVLLMAGSFMASRTVFRAHDEVKVIIHEESGVECIVKDKSTLECW